MSKIHQSPRKGDSKDDWSWWWGYWILTCGQCGWNVPISQSYVTMSISLSLLFIYSVHLCLYHYCPLEMSVSHSLVCSNTVWVNSYCHESVAIYSVLFLYKIDTLVLILTQVWWNPSTYSLYALSHVCFIHSHVIELIHPFHFEFSVSWLNSFKDSLTHVCTHKSLIVIWKIMFLIQISISHILCTSCTVNTHISEMNNGITLETNTHT